MEWDQIAEKWAAMTLRLRSDCAARPPSIGAAQEARRAPRPVDRQSSKKKTLESVGDDQRLT